MTKMEKEYEKEYGDIPEDYLKRIDYLIKGVDLSRHKLHVYDIIRRNMNLKWKRVHYTIYLLPKATPRPRSGKNGIFYVRGASDNKKFFKEFAKNLDIPLITTPTRFYCSCYLPIPKSMNIVEQICAELGFGYPISKPDWDNLGKTYCDMIQSILLYDDSLIVDGFTRKRYSIKPRIEIEIFYLEDFDLAYNRNKIMKKGEKQ